MCLVWLCYLKPTVQLFLYTPRSTVFLEKLTGFQLRNSPHFMEPEGWLSRLQVPSTCPYPEPDQSSPCPPNPLQKIHFNITLSSPPGSSKWCLSLRFPHQHPVYTSPLPIPATYPAHLINHDLITRTILGERYRSLSSSFFFYFSWFHASCLNFVNKTSLMQFVRYLLYPSQLYMFRMSLPSILRSTGMYRPEGTIYVHM